jgi:hypothetical protein
LELKGIVPPKIEKMFKKFVHIFLFVKFSQKMSSYISITQVFYEAYLQGCTASTSTPFSPPPPQGCACREWGSTGSLNPIAAALVMALTLWGLEVII